MKEICALCQNISTLRESHIIPEFLYKAMYDEKHRFHEISTLKKKHKLRQKGLKEKLLCGKCEAQLSKYEKYASQVIKKTINLPTLPDKKFILIKDVNYINFKLFQLSILWRSSVSRSYIFRDVDLGENHENKIREMLISESPGNSDMYGCIIARLSNNGKTLKDLIVQPEKFRIRQHIAYRFVFGGFIWVYIVSNHAKPNAFSQVFIKEDGPLLICLKDAESFVPLIDIANKIVAKAKNPS